LVFDKNKFEFSHPKTVQAIGSKKKKQTNPKPKTKSEQVISHYISRDLESEEEEWNVTPEWDQRVEKKEVKQEVESSEEDEFYDLPELDTGTGIDPDNYNLIPKEEPETKSVRFLPYVQQRKYYPDSDLQTYEDEKDELLRAAKAAVQKVKEEIEDAGEQGPFTSEASSTESRGRLSRHSTDLNQQQRQRDLDAGTIGQQRGRSSSVPSGGRSPSGAQRTTHGRALPQVSDTSGVHNQSGTLSSTDRSSTALRKGGESQSGVPRQDPGTGTKRRTDTTTTATGTTGASSKNVHPGSRRDGTEGSPRSPRSSGGSRSGAQPGTKGSQLQTGSLGKGHSTELGKGHGSSTGSHGSSTIPDRGMVTPFGSDATGNLPAGRFGGFSIGKSAGMGSAKLPLPATADRGADASTDGRVDPTSNLASAPEPATTNEEPKTEPDERRSTRKSMEESIQPGSGAGALPTDPPAHEGGRDSTRRRSSSAGGQTGKSPRPSTRSQADTQQDEFGLSPFYPGPEGFNPSYYVIMLAETWCRDRQRLRDRIINGENIPWRTVTEHKRRFEFIKREGDRTKAAMPPRFTLD
jgi:hypothetical protein